MPINLIKLILSNVDEEAIEAAHARVALFLAGGLARRKILIAVQSMIATITTVAAASTHTIVREARAETEVLMSAHSSRCLRWKLRSKRLLSWLHLNSIYLLPCGLEHRSCFGCRLSSCGSAPRYSGVLDGGLD